MMMINIKWKDSQAIIPRGVPVDKPLPIIRIHTLKDGEIKELKLVSLPGNYPATPNPNKEIVNNSYPLYKEL